jgi:glycosyltransferase involved in cell wall biosynthesis
MNKKSIVLVYHTLNIGGAEKELLSIVKHIDQKIFNVSLILTEKTGELLQDVPKEIKVFKIGGDSIKPDIKHIHNLSIKLKAIKPDVVIGFMQDICFNILATKLIYNLTYKVIISEDAVLSEWQNFYATPWPKRMAVNFLYKLADAYIAPSQEILDDLHDYCGISQSKMTVLPNYFKPKDIYQRKTLTRKILTHKNYFLFIGRFHEQKNLRLLLTAFKLLLQNIEYQSFTLVLIGKDHENIYRSYCKTLGIQSNVVFLGYIRDIAPYYRNALAFILPSNAEGMPRVAVQAILNKCPLILSNFAGHTALVSNYFDGLVFPKNSAVHLKRCMEYYIHNKNRRKQFAQNAFSRIKKIYTDTFEDNYKQIINNLLTSIVK